MLFIFIIRFHCRKNEKSVIVFIMQYEVIKINENTWRIEDQGVRFFLLTGSESALLIDSGMNVHNARDVPV